MQTHKGILILLLTLLTQFAMSQIAVNTNQQQDSTKAVHQYSGLVTVTNNGISLIPSFSLGKPAALFNLTVGSKKLTFEPELRFALTGKPWSFIFWWRYHLINHTKFKLNVGAHPSFLYKSETVVENGISKELIIARRYLATEIAPRFELKKNVSVGMYYLYSHGLDDGTVGNTHFITINSSISNIKLYKDFYLKAVPQLYYLNMDAVDGFYGTATLTLSKKNCPVSISSIINQTISTHLTGSKNFVWNLSLVYAFGN